MFLLVIKPAATGAGDLGFGTLYGGSINVGGVAVSGNHAYVVGEASTGNWGTSGTYQGSKNGATDALVVSFTIFQNAAPELSGAVQPPATPEDGGGGSGFLVSSLIAGKVSDVDGSGLPGIAVTAVNTSGGTWQYSLDGGTNWNTLTASATSALLLAADAQSRIRFVPAANFNGTVTGGLTFRAWDRSSGAAGGTANTSTSGGSTAFSLQSASIDMVVSPVNDPPERIAGSVAPLTVQEDAPAAVAATKPARGSASRSPAFRRPPSAGSFWRMAAPWSPPRPATA
jgi:hypothetical protein